MELREAYGELRVEVGAPLPACRAAWLHWNKLLHPDRVDGSAAANASAEDQLKLINEAWDVIKAHHPTSPAGTTTPPRPDPRPDREGQPRPPGARLITCAACGASNHVPDESTTARCGRCGLPILDEGAARRPSFTAAKATRFLVEEVHLLAIVESAGKALPDRWAPLLAMPYDQLTSRQLTRIQDLGVELAGLLAEAARTDPQVLDAYRAACAADDPPAVVALFADLFAA